MVRVFFWVEEEDAYFVDLSLQTNQLLNIRAKNSHKRSVDILREAFELFGKVTESNLVDYLNMMVKPV